MRRVSIWTLPLLGFGAGIVFVATCTDGSVPGLEDAGDAGIGRDGVVLDGDGEGDSGDAPADEDQGAQDAMPDDGTDHPPPLDSTDGTPGGSDADVLAEVDAEGGALDGFLDMSGADAAPDGDAAGAGCPCAGQAEELAELKERVEALEQRPGPLVAVNADGERLGTITNVTDGKPESFSFFDTVSGRVYRYANGQLDLLKDNSSVSVPLPVLFETSDCTGAAWITENGLAAPEEGIGWNPNSGQAYAVEEPGLTKTLQSGSFVAEDGACKTFEESDAFNDPVVTPATEIEVGFDVPPKFPYAVEQVGP